MDASWIIPLISLAAMEIVLGIDNIVFIAILVGKLPAAQQERARRLGLGLALGTRLLLLFALSWILGLSQPLFSLTSLGVPEGWLSTDAQEISWRDIILIVGGAFLIGKATTEVHHKLEGPADDTARPVKVSFGMVLTQIALLDVVFSLDSVITAVGMVGKLWIMVTAMIIAVLVMLVFAAPLGRFVERHPTLKILALSFLILIGVLLVAEGLGQHIERGYIYFAMGFSLVVELINLRVRAAGQPVELHEPRLDP